VITDFGAGGVYRSGDRDAIRAYADTGALPRIDLLDEELATDEVAALYRSCDVLVHPYRGEDFAMPVLEAMACGLPVIATGGGPTDEFCPPEAGWRIRSRRAHFPSERVDTLETAGRPWVLEPGHDDLMRLLRHAAADAEDRKRRGAAGRIAARTLSWDAVAARYQERIGKLSARQPLLAGAHSAEHVSARGGGLRTPAGHARLAHRRSPRRARGTGTPRRRSCRRAHRRRCGHQRAD
jgi:glycosyltransferase involved in cell wall biosynthesis